MKTHRSLWHAAMRAGGWAGSARHEAPKGAVRVRVTRGILVLALVLGGLGGAALALPGHGSAGHVQAPAHQPASDLVHPAAASSTSSVSALRRPWMY